MPMSCTSTPLARRPFASACASSGPDRRPSRPTAMPVPPAFRTSVPIARPISSTVGAESCRPTTPRMSYALKISGGTRLIAQSSFDLVEEGHYPLRQPVVAAGKRPVHEADVATGVRELEHDLRRDRIGARQADRREKRVVPGVHH